MCIDTDKSMDLYLRYHRPTHLVGGHSPVGLIVETRARVNVTYGACAIHYIYLYLSIFYLSIYLSLRYRPPHLLGDPTGRAHCVL